MLKKVYILIWDVLWLLDPIEPCFRTVDIIFFKQCHGKEFWHLGQSPQQELALILLTDLGGVLGQECTQLWEPPFPCPPQTSCWKLRPVTCPSWAAPVVAPSLWHLPRLPCSPPLPPCYATVFKLASVWSYLCLGFWTLETKDFKHK